MMKGNEKSSGAERPGPFVKEILDGIDIGVVLLDKGEKVIFANKASKEILGEKGDLLLGKRLLNLLYQGDEGQGRIKGDGQILFQKKKEGPPIKLLIFPYHDSSGRERGKVVNLQDMTQIYKMQEEILKMDRLAYLGEFSSTLAHEIRNPLAGIKTTAQALNEELGKDDHRKEYLDRIIKEIDRLNDLLRTFFSFVKPRRLNLAPCHIQDIIKEVKGLLTKEAEKTGIMIKEVYANGLPPIPLDFNQMQQVFMNLFLNALHAMPVGGELVVEVSKRNSQKGWIQIKVKDTGKGIAPEHLPKIFDPFYTTKSKGLGLGLSITHKIVEGHGGKIAVESYLGKGSTFIIKLPMAMENGDQT
ncbi:MAG: PAS domain-containing protein [Deltaproteobacteria bacterium]|nr:PAS domain-containing protein [Deltaproteobacteria bacterium]